MPGRVIGLILLLTSTSMAQFVVQPMKKELLVRSGAVLKERILLQNYAGEDTRPVKLEVVDLRQSSEGQWATDASHGVDANNVDTNRSCRTWITLSQTEALVQGGGNEEIELLIKVPAGVRGFYCAAVAATLAPRPGASRISVSYQMIVPILIEIEGIPLVHKVSLDKVEVAPITGEDGKGSTELIFTVSNVGSTLSRTAAKGWVKYWDQSGDRWKPVVSEIDMADGTLIPGAKVTYRKDIGKELPSGKYRLLGVLSVDGRQGKTYDEEVAFEGNPEVLLVEDTAIRCASEFVELEGQTGRSCRGVLELRNYSFNSVVVTMQATIPAEMKGKIWYGRKGEDMSCADWISIRPEEITLKPFGAKNVRVNATIPTGGLSKGFYADLEFIAKYEKDMSNAGSVKVRACVLDKLIKEDLKVKAHGLKLNRLDGPGERFIVGATYGNLGDFHLIPQVKARLFSAASQQAFEEWELVNESKANILLPYEKRSFTAVMSLAGIEEGEYRLDSVLINDGEEVASNQKSLKIYREGGQRVVEIIADAPDQSAVGSESPTYSW